MSCEKCVLDLNSNQIGMSSRGYTEELWCGVKHLLATETHLEENIANFTRLGYIDDIPKLAFTLDTVRRLRQNLVQLALREEKHLTIGGV